MSSFFSSVLGVNTRYSVSIIQGTMLKPLNNALSVLMLLLPLVSVGQYSGTGTFTKITSLAELTDGYYVITNETDAFAMNNAHTGTLLPEDH